MGKIDATAIDRCMFANDRCILDAYLMGKIDETALAICMFEVAIIAQRSSGRFNRRTALLY